MIELEPQELEIVQQLLQQHVPECEVRAFGSRVAMTAKPYSDLDLVVIAEEKIASDRLSELKEAFVDSDLPFRVDVLDWRRIADEFKAVIMKQYLVIQKSP